MHSAPAARAISVGELTRQIKDRLEGGFRNVWIAGEIGACKTHSSGHLYLTLKDEEARIDAVLWRSAASLLRFRPQIGQQVLALGRLTVYPPRGAYQLVVDRLEPAGAGALDARLQALKAQLAAEGLFEPGRKRPLPFLPRRVGVVTSGSGAARRDIEAVLHRRSPQIPLVLYPATVQGDAAAADIARGLRVLCGLPGVEVIIVGRGGGSAEDLGAFNSEAVARAIASCPVPVISAVGHETDTTLADLVADRRAPTPSAAAEAAVPVRDDLLLGLDALVQRLDGAAERRVRRCRERLDGLEARVRAGLRFHDRRLALSQLQGRLERALNRRLQGDAARLTGLRHRLAEQHPSARLARCRHTLERARARLAALGPRPAELARAELRLLAARLAALSPLASLERGYSITRHAGHVVRAHDELRPGDETITLLHAGWLRATVTATGGGPAPTAGQPDSCAQEDT